MTTAIQVDNEIATLNEQIAAFEVDRKSITVQIADTWGSDTSLLERRYGELGVKLEAAKIVLERLKTKRTDAARTDAQADLQAAVEALAAAAEVVNRADAKLVEAWVKLIKTAVAAYQEAEASYYVADQRVDRLANAAEAAGVPFAEISTIRWQYPIERTAAARDIAELTEVFYRRHSAGVSII